MKIITMNQVELQKIDLSALHKVVAIVSVKLDYAKKCSGPFIRRVLHLTADEITAEDLNDFVEWSKKALLDEIWICCDDAEISLYIKNFITNN